MNEAEAESGLRKMAAEVGDPLGGVLRSLFNMLDHERAEALVLKARLDGTTSAIPAIVANHTRSHRDEFTRFLAAYESMRRRFGDEYEGRFSECDELVKRHDEHERARPRP